MLTTSGLTLMDEKLATSEESSITRETVTREQGTNMFPICNLTRLWRNIRRRNHSKEPFGPQLLNIKLLKRMKGILISPKNIEVVPVGQLQDSPPLLRTLEVLQVLEKLTGPRVGPRGVLKVHQGRGKPVEGRRLRGFEVETTKHGV